jgi:hypothetical protein
MLSGGIRGATVTVNRGIERALNELGGVRSPEMRKAGNTLARSIRKTLSVSGGGGLATRLSSRATHVVGGTPSSPGQPPHRQTGHLAKSVKAAPSGDAIKVGPLAFTSLFLEEGVKAVKGETRTSRGRRNRSRVTKKRKTLTIAARPFMAKALAAARDKMVDVFVAEGRKHLERA